MEPQKKFISLHHQTSKTSSMMKKLFFLIVMVLTLSSCNTQYRAMGQLRSLTNEIERNGEFYNGQDWKNAYAEYQDINSRIDQQRLTSQQRQELGQLKGRCVAGFAKSSVKSIKNAISEGAGIIEGIIDGLTK